MRVCIKNLGCKVNNYECEFVRNLFIKNNDEIVEDNADVYVVNTCTVTNTSDAKSKKIIRRIRRENKDAILVVMGCFTQNLKEKANEVIDADIIIGNKDKSKVVELVKEFIETKKQKTVFYDMMNQEFEDMEIDTFESRTRAFVKIQDGCNNYCSYCIIPFVRGNLRSKNKEKIINEITSLVKNGHKEIVLTGIHTGQYGSDSTYKLVDLIKDILKIKDLYRLRISSIEITEVNDELLELFKNNKIIANHFHIPLQSGCDKILKLMNRKYDTSYFYDKVKKIRSIREDVSITTDVSVGFPNETDEDFLSTYNFCKKIEFSKIHVFPYSDRNGTVASKMKNKVEGNIKKQRTHKLLELSKNLENEFNNKNEGKIFEIIIEEKKDDLYIGHTSNFIKVYLKDNVKLNEIYKVKLVKIYKDGIIGELINEKANCI